MNAAKAAAAIALLLSGSPFAAAETATQEPAYIDMQGTSIIGDRELPNVLYIVPWKDATPAAAELQTQTRHADPPPGYIARDAVQRQLRRQQQNAAANPGTSPGTGAGR